MTVPLDIKPDGWFLVECGHDGAACLLLEGEQVQPEVHRLFCMCDDAGSCDNAYFADFKDANDWGEHDWECQLEDGYVNVYRLTSPPALVEETKRLRALLNTPEVEDFDKGVPLEAAHQVLRWGTQHDAGKNAEDWFWLVGYLAGKALAAQKSGDREKAKHHCISTAAALRNWHAHLRSGASEMRPGILPPEGE
jgi:hypothetical protein